MLIAFYDLHTYLIGGTIKVLSLIKLKSDYILRETSLLKIRKYLHFSLLILYFLKYSPYDKMVLYG